MTYAFRRGIFHCVSDGYTILLDVRRDRYFALNDAQHGAIGRLEAGHHPAPQDADILNRLLSQGLLVHSEHSKIGLEILAKPAARDFRAVSADPTPWQVWAAFVSQLRARAILRRHGLGQSLEWAAQASNDGDGNVSVARDELTLQIAAAARRAALLTSAHDRCLPNSVALRRCLAKARCTSRLVLGVTARPFRAHAWVQSGDNVLNDTLDALRGFTPIYAQ